MDVTVTVCPASMGTSSWLMSIPLENGAPFLVGWVLKPGHLEMLWPLSLLPHSPHSTLFTEGSLISPRLACAWTREPGGAGEMARQIKHSVTQV